MLPGAPSNGRDRPFNGELHKTLNFFPGELVSMPNGNVARELLEKTRNSLAASRGHYDLGTPGYLKTAFLHYRALAWRGDSAGMLGLADMYLQGEVGSARQPDYTSCEFWLWQALRCCPDNLSIVTSLAGLYLMGEGALHFPDMTNLLQQAALGNVGAKIEITRLLIDIPAFSPSRAV